MNKTLLFFFSLSIILSACTQPESKVEVKKRIAKGNRAYGGTFKLNENEECQTLFPYSIIDAVSSRIVAQIYEGLVKKSSKDLSIKPSIAESWEIDTTGTIYTFKLKKGIYFHDDPCFPNGKGREVTAQDFKFSFEMLCTQKINDSIENVMFAQTLKDRVLGANKFYEASKKGKPNFDLEGVKVIDDYTLQITLSKPNMSFIYILAYPEVSVIPREGLEKYGEMLTIGTGPFVFFDWYEEDNKETGESEEFLVLTRNENYHGYDTLGNQLPYLDTIFTSFINSQKRELKMFQEKKLDIVLGIPAESIRDIVEQQIAYFEKKPPEFILERSADMATNYYSFILNKQIFNDEFGGKKVRQAFSYAINRNKIIESVLRGEAYGPGIHGISPPSFKDYDITKIKGYDFNPEKARKLLAEAGYPDGKDFPVVKLELNSGGFRNTSVAFEIQKQLRSVLNINIELEIVSMEQKLEDERYGRADMFRSAWIADYPSPENFLLLLYGKIVPESLEEPSYLNASRYINPEYDKLYEAGIITKSIEERYKYFIEAEQIMINDAPIIVLWYDENYRLLQANVQNFNINPMRFRDMSEVYLMETIYDTDIQEENLQKLPPVEQTEEENESEVSDN